MVTSHEKRICVLQYGVYRYSACYVITNVLVVKAGSSQVLGGGIDPTTFSP